MRVIINTKLIIFASCDSCLNALKFLAILQSSCLLLQTKSPVETFCAYICWTRTSPSSVTISFLSTFYQHFYVIIVIQMININY